jgi:leucyl-tRNA synthetase
MVLAPGGGKMSKSKGNVINPDSVIAEYGADALRLYEMFMAPFSQEVSWSTSSIQGVHRFLKKVWQTCNNPDHITDDAKEEDLLASRELQRLISKVESDMTDVKLNTIVSSFMEFINVWASSNSGLPRKLTRDHVGNFIQLLAPFAPFLTEELWFTLLGKATTVHRSSWPISTESLAEDSDTTLAIQVNGKLRSTMTVRRDIGEKELVSLVVNERSLQKWLEGKNYRPIYIQGKVLNFVLEE